MLLVMVADELNLGGTIEIVYIMRDAGFAGWLGFIRALGMLGACKCDMGDVGSGWKDHGKLATPLYDWSM